MTEEEAKQKWCPFAQSRSVKTVKMDGTALHETMTVNGEESAKPLCLGKDCMAWRNGKIEENPNGLHPHTWPDLKPYHNEDSARRFIRHGYCGLAGQPDDLP